MAIGLIGQKCGMTRVFTEAGESVSVSVVRVENNRVLQVKTKEKDGYNSIQVGICEQKPSRVNKPMAGHFGRAQVGTAHKLHEFSIEDGVQCPELASAYGVELFDQGQIVDVQGVTKGKGFAGVVKRHNFATQDATHGNSLSHRGHGSIGQNQTPGRVFKGKRMSGHMGSVNRTIPNLSVFRVDKDRGLLMIKGAIPGSIGGYVVIKPTAKKRRGK